MFYSNTRREHQVTIQFLDIAGIVDGTDTISITDGTLTRTYTFETAEVIGSQEFQRFTAGATLADNVRDTMKSFVRVVNRDTGQSIWYAYYISGSDDAPGKVLIRRRDYTDTALSITATAGAGSNFQPQLPTSGSTVSTSAEKFANRLYHSKFEQPDNVPRDNIDEIGPARDGIIRILPLNDSLIILTERKVFRLSGEDEESFTIRELDPSVRIRASETAVVLNHAVYAYTSQNVVRITENSIEIISRPIEFELNKIIEISNFDTLSFAVAYEEERQYWLFTPDVSTDTFPTLAWVYNFVTKAWVQREKKVTSGIVLKEGDRMFLAHAQDKNVLKERKSFSDTQEDFVDEAIAVTIDVVSTTTNSDNDLVSLIDLTYTYTNRDFDDGFVLFQGTSKGRIVSFTELTTTTFRVELDNLSEWVTGAANVSLNIVSNITWAPETLGDPSFTKQFSRVQIYMQEDTGLRHFIGFTSDTTADEEFTAEYKVPLGVGWGTPGWGDAPWGDDAASVSTPLRVTVPIKFQRCRGLTVLYRHKFGEASFIMSQLAIQSRVVSERTVRNPR